MKNTQASAPANGASPAAGANAANTTGLLIYPEAAAYIRTSRRFLEKEVSLGRLPAVRLSRKAVRFRLVDLERYAARSLTTVKGGN